MPLEIITYPHPTLRHRSRPIKRVDSRLREIAAEMLELMYLSKGVGLAANQVNIPLRMFVVNAAGQPGEGEELVLLNPVLQLPKGSDVAEEGCLSLPGLYGPVMRPKEIRLSAFDIEGHAIERRVDGFLARVLQHESDHLDGTLFFDRMTPEAREELREDLELMEGDFRRAQQAGSLPDAAAMQAALAEWEQRYA